MFSPDIVFPSEPLPGFPDLHLMEALFGALPPLNKLKDGLTLQTVRVLRGTEPLPPNMSANPSFPAQYLDALIQSDETEQTVVDLWRGFTRIEVRVVRGDRRRRPLASSPTPVPSPRTPIGSAATELEPVE